MKLKTLTFTGSLICVTLLSLLFISCKQKETKQPHKPVTPDWAKNLSIYELNVRQYTPEGTLRAFEEKLPELKEMGVGIIWFMPIHPISKLNRKGTLGSYYAVQDYKAVNPEFGTIEEFKALVKEIHDMGMYVIIDWVANHTGWDNVWTETNPDFYSKDSLGNFYPPVEDWSDTIDLNYDNPELHNAMIDALKFWVTECDIDGFRCDVAAMVPTEFWEKARKELDEVKPVFMLAEANENYLHPSFDMTYNWPLKDLMNSIAKGENKAVDLEKFFTEQTKEYRVQDYRMNFTTNHDENTWNGTVFERLGDGAEAFNVLCGTVKGMPLIYSGEEAGLDKRLSFFEKDLIDWKEHKFRELFATLNNLKKDNKALWNGDMGGEMKFIHTMNENIFAFHREKDGNQITALFNFSDKDQSITFIDSAVAGEYKDLFTGEMISFSETGNKFELAPWDYKVLVK